MPVGHAERLKWCMLTLLLLGSAIAEDSISCPCIPIELCSKQNGDHLSCEDPGMIYCCSRIDISDSKKTRKMEEVITEHLNNERQINEVLEKYFEKINGTSQTEEIRMVKSIASLSKNQLCEGKSCSDIKSTDKVNTNAGLVNLDNLPSDTMTKLRSEEELMEEYNDNKKSKNNLFIVYAENPKQNNALNEKSSEPYVVLPMENKTINNDEFSPLVTAYFNTSHNNSGNNVNKGELLAKEADIFTTSHKNPRIGLKNSESEVLEIVEEKEEINKEGSEIEEVKIRPTNSLPAQSIVIPPLEERNQQKPAFRAPLRRLKPQPIKIEGNRQTNKNILALLREQSKGRVGLKPLNKEIVAQETPNESIMATKMDDINIKTINNIMRTNFTRRPTFIRRPTGPLQNEQNAAQKSTEAEISNDQIKRPIVEASKFVQRGRFRLRNSNTSQMSPSNPPQDSESISKEASNNQLSLRRNTPSNLLKIINNSHRFSESRNNEDTIEDAPVGLTQPTFNSNRLHPRTRTKSHSVSPNTNTFVKAEENSKPTIETNSKTVLTNANDDVNYEYDEQISSNTQFDLESSGTENTSQKSKPPKMFNPPEMETGFQPMFRSRNLKIIGPIPGGFIDSSRGFPNADRIGLKLPQQPPTQNFNFNSDFENSDKFNQGVLPPTYQSFSNENSQTFSNDFIESEMLSLLPPVETPKPLMSKGAFELLPPVKTPKPPMSQVFELLPPLETPKPLQVVNTRPQLDFTNKSSQPFSIINEQGSTELRTEFGNLNNKYESLLQRYAEVLNAYNAKYKDLD